jgi:hypothetical protein
MTGGKQAWKKCSLGISRFTTFTPRIAAAISRSH